MGDRTAIPPYDYEHLRVTAHDMPPIVRAAWLRGVSALPNTFAHESFIDECASEAGVDPIEYRLRYLKDTRAIDLVHAVAERAGWQKRPVRQEKIPEGDIVRGRGFAYALYVHSKFPGYGAAWSAWVADVAVNKATGDISVTRVVAGQDSGLMINPDGVRHQIHGNVVQSTSRALMEEVAFERTAVATREWGAYPIIKFPEVPDIDVLMLPRQDQPPLGVGESASVPSAAAIVNAIYDATGVRFRELPLTPERVLKGLHEHESAAPPAIAAPAQARPNPDVWRNPFAKRAGIFAGIAAVCTAVIGIGAAILPWRAIAPIARPDPSVFSAATIARGEQLAALGDCAVCHTQRKWRRQCRRPADSKRRSASSTAPTSRPMSKPASAPGPIPPSNARCAKAFIATAAISIRRFPIRILPRRATPICRRSTLTSWHNSPCARLRRTMRCDFHSASVP